MSTDEFFQRLQATLNDLRSTREASAIFIAGDVLALLKSRVINTGKDDKLKKIGTYSTAVVPIWMYKDKEKRRKNAVEALLKTYGYFASYRDWRVVNGLEVQFKNFQFTGHMWHSIGPIVIEKDDTSVTIGITAGTDNAVKKLRHVIAKHPNILNFSKAEQDALSKAQSKRLVAALIRNGILGGGGIAV